MSSLRGGGAERQACLWADACASLGFEVRVLALREREGAFPLPQSVRVDFAGKAGSLDLIRLRRAVRGLSRDVDVVAAFQPYCALLCAIAQLGRPWLVVTGEDPRRFADTSRVPASALRWALDRARLRAAPTEGLIDCHRRLGIAPHKPWSRIPNIVDGAAFVESTDSKRGALFVGRLVPEKDPMMAIAVCRRAGIPLTVLGEGPLASDVERQMADGGSRHTRLLGYTPNPWSLYAEHRLCVVTSHYEAFGNMIVESLAAGTPVVAADCDFGPREVLSDARFSRLVARDQAQLASGVAEVHTRAYTADEAADCRETAARYASDRLAPSIARALECTLSANRLETA